MGRTELNSEYLSSFLFFAFRLYLIEFQDPGVYVPNVF